MAKDGFSAAEARRIVLGAQGFGGPRTRGALASVRKLGDRLGAYQIDSVNVLVRAHFMPAFSRLGPYPLDTLDKLTYDKREFFEYWGHAACYLPMSLYPAWRWRMEGRSDEGYTGDRRKALDTVYKWVADHGPVGAGKIDVGRKGKGGWWGWSDAKMAVESLFRMGRVAVASRNNFERLYDITERVIPAEVLSRPALSADDGKKHLLELAAKAHGIGTADDIGGYFYIENWWDRAREKGKRKSQLPRLIGELVDEGRLVPVAVEGWTKPAYVVPRTKVPKAIDVRALLSPFDPVMWNRAPTERIFGFDYKIEIYVPAPKRIYGYYCLPFLLGDRFVGRVDLKADRKTSTLLVPGAFAEAGVNTKQVASHLADELRLMADWLGLESISVGPKGDLAKPLARLV